MRRACRAASVEGAILHGLRHFHASGLIAASRDVVTVQRALGYAKGDHDAELLPHLWPTAEDRTRAAASDMLSTALGTPADHVRDWRGGITL